MFKNLIITLVLLVTTQAISSSKGDFIIKKVDNIRNPSQSYLMDIEIESSESVEGPWKGEVKIKIYPFDEKSKDKDIPLAWPILPPHLWVEPREGELMIVFFQNPQYPYKGRFYIGPLTGSHAVNDQLFDEVLDDIWSVDKDDRSQDTETGQSTTEGETIVG